MRLPIGPRWSSAPLCLCGLLLANCGEPGARCLSYPASSHSTATMLDRCAAAHRATPGNRRIFEHYARMLWARRAPRQLARACVQALRRDPRQAEAHYYLAVALRQLGRCDKALPHYRRYAEQRPEDSNVHFGIALCQEQLGQTQAATAAFEHFLRGASQADPSSWRPRARRHLTRLRGQAVDVRPGTSQQRQRDAQAASKDLRPTPRRGPGADTPPNDGQIARARPSARIRPRAASGSGCRAERAAVKAAPLETASYDQLARCALAERDFAQLIRSLRTALRDNPAYARGWLHLAQAYEGLGQIAAAKRAYRRACGGGVNSACSR